MTKLSVKHLLDIESLTRQDILTIIDTADNYANGHVSLDKLSRRIILNTFFENSTRTRLSFEMAAKKLGAQVMNMAVESSSVKKGESMLDTLQTLNAMRPDALVIRHREHGTQEFAASIMDCPVINAGEGSRAHPTQALLDALTIKRALGRLENFTIAICGDIAHSRVARSNIVLLQKLGGIKIHVIAPASLAPNADEFENIETFTSLEEGLVGCDIVMMLRIQKERMDGEDVPDDAAYFQQLGLTEDRLALANPNAYVMHPGPMNRDVEIAASIADMEERSLIPQQVANGVFTRMAVQELLINGQ